MTVAAFINRSRDDKESWRYTDLEKLLAAPQPAPGDPKTSLSANAEASCLVFLNGVYQGKQSTTGVLPSCMLMGDAANGYELILGPHTCLATQPIELIFHADETAGNEVAIKLSVKIGENSRLSLLENHLPAAAITTLELDIELSPRAKMLHGKLVAGNAHLARTQVSVASGAYYNNFSLLRGGRPIRNEIDVRLTGAEAQTHLNGAMLLRDSDHADTTLRIQHQAPNCASRQVYKSVLDGKSRGVFQGKIIVAPDAQKTDGYQLSRALLLSDQAEIDAKPELEIYADDVKCSHGSSIGDLDEDALFYLRARGLSETQARDLLIDGFIGEMFDEIQVETWRPVFEAATKGWLR